VAIAGRRRRILFVGEAVTLAHVARPLALAQGLDPSRYEAILAMSPRSAAMAEGSGLAVRPIRSIPGEQFLAALDCGRPVYDAATLRDYVRDDLDLLGEVRPDVVVGDFRLSLAVSARVAKVPYATITNAYWSPYATGGFPMPEFPPSRALGVRLARPLFALARPLAFALHCRPLNRVRREFGLPGVGGDLRRAYTEADRTLYADVPELVPTVGLPEHHRYLGPVLWSPPVPRPDWWGDIPADRPLIYLTLGSSGRAERLPALLEALTDLPAFVVAASARPEVPARVPANARVAPFLPGREVAARARLVVCNGGSPTTHQALAAGVPVLGLPQNLDQHLNMQAIVQFGAGAMLRSEWATAAAVRAAVTRLLADPAPARRAGEVAALFARCNAARQLDAALSTIA
jgi:UDP:flavonoid glycosyltransferase YjiC (YdhE family)